ncbi:MAG: DUF1501 domain-containing protein [Halieaceae bacterium]|jgi:uncharacterized protein (DUF1501 family)|nr:DUF1501 domain-containing protein [Halieaceae bacterium]
MIKRRTFLKSTGLLGALPLLTPRIGWAMDGQSDNILITVFLGGGADGLNIIAPVGEGNYFDLRPTLALKAPGSGEGSSLDLDGFYAMHEAMGKLHTRFHSGELAVVQATGLTSESHSHFDSQSLMERGIASEQNILDGWLNRHLALQADQDSVFHAVGLHDSLPVSLSGDYPAISMSSIAEFGLNAPQVLELKLSETLSQLYNQNSLLDVEAGKALDAMAEMRYADPAQYEPENGAEYPDTQFGQHFRELSQLIRADLGVATASLALHGWDHHDNQTQVLPGILAELSDTLDAFALDMGADMDRITIVTMSEFGRRAWENSSAGFDHGYGSFMLAMGAGVVGGQVYGDWPGLGSNNLVFSGDLDITTDYRTVLAELLYKRFGQTDIATVFPDLIAEPELGVFTA